MRCRTEWRVAGLGLLAATALSAIYVRSDLEKVPFERLLSNAEARVEAAPNDVGELNNLARIHAMAYAWKLGDEDVVDATTLGDDGPLVPSFGYEPPWVPWTRSRQDSTAAPTNGGGHGDESEAREHLARAVELYRRAVAGDPEEPGVLRLGLAWTLIESGEEDEARDLLRSVVAVASARELEAGGHLGPLLSVEAIDYLLPLLDPNADRAEIAELNELRGRLEALPRAITPIAVALRPGMAPDELIDRLRPVRFDLDGSGRELPWTWLSDDAAWLVWDPHGDGAVGSALQLFGARTFGLFFEDGYQALELLDDDRDGVLRGAELRGLALWRDRDRDGRSSPAEVASVVELGVVALGCRPTARRDGVLGAPASVELGDGRRLDSWDLVVETALRP